MFVPIFAHAQNQNWESWFSSQINKHPDIVAAKEQLLSTGALADASERALYNPELSTDYTRNGDNNDYSVGIEQTIDLWDRQGARRQKAGFMRTAAQAQYQEVVLNKSADAIDALINWHAAKRAASIAKSQQQQLNSLLELVEMEVRDLLTFYKYDGDNTPVVLGSALGALNGEAKWVETVAKLMDSVDSWIELPQREVDKDFLMPIEDVFSITGRGTVATGRIETGVANTGDAVDIIGMGAEKLGSTVTGVEMFRKILDRGEAGDNVGILLRGIEKTDISRGMVICKPGSVKPHKKFKAEVYILKKEEGGRHTPFHNNYRPQFYVRTTDVTGNIELPSGVEMVMPGDNLTITVELIQPIACSVGLRFAIREGGRTVGAGQVTEILD